MNKKKLFSLLMAGCLCVGALSGCGTKVEDTATPDADVATPDTSTTEEEDLSLQAVLDKGTLVLGLDDSFPPMGFNDGGEIVGFDIDVARKVCEKLGVELELQPISWDAKQFELDSYNVDCLWNGFSRTEEREKACNLSIAYLENHMALVVLPDSGITSIADMAGKSLALQNGSSAEEALASEAGTELREAIASTNGFDENLGALLDLEAGGSDALLVDDIVAKYLIETSGKNMIILGDFLFAEDYTIGFRKADVALTDAVNDALRELKADGTLAEISTKWFGEDIIPEM